MRPVILPNFQGLRLPSPGLLIDFQGASAVQFGERETPTIKFKVAVEIVKIPHLTCAAVLSAVYSPIQDDARSHTRTQGYSDHIAVTFGLAVEVLPQRKTIGIIFNTNRNPELPFKYSLQFDPFPGRYIHDIVY